MALQHKSNDAGKIKNVAMANFATNFALKDLKVLLQASLESIVCTIFPLFDVYINRNALRISFCLE